MNSIARLRTRRESPVFSFQNHSASLAINGALATTFGVSDQVGSHARLMSVASIGKARGFRPDIEGLRAIAVLLVLLYHSGLPVSGGYVGVDVFFVISGFLITGLLLRQTEKTGTVSLLEFYARRVKRLLPAACAVLLVSVGVTAWLGPSTERGVFALDVVAAGAYFVNWRFADRSVDYLAEDVGRSPVLHFWSLSVEEQFYFIWPLLILLSGILAKRLNMAQRKVSALALSFVLVPSFVWSIIFTEHSSAEAFFVTTTRLWELSIGAMLAVFLPALLAWPVRLGPLLAWLGLAAIAASALAFDDRTSWPGLFALGPTLGAALVILGGSLGAGRAIELTLASRPMVWIGGLSYSIYLWHWPLVVVGQDWLDLRGPLLGTLLVCSSLIPAWVSYRLLEQPVRYARLLTKLPGLTLGLGASLSVVAIAAGSLVYLRQESADATTPRDGKFELLALPGEVVAKPKDMGAGALGARPRASLAGTPHDSYESVVPVPSRAPKDVPTAYKRGCQALYVESEPKWCESGDRESKQRIVVVGDSKVLQYFDALDAVGKAYRWRILTATKSRCPFTNAMVRHHDGIYYSCREFNEKVMDHLLKEPPLAVITSQRFKEGFLPDKVPKEDKSPKQDEASMIQGLVDYWSRLEKNGTTVVGLLDNPSPPRGKKVYRCVADHPNDALECVFSREEARARSGASVFVAAAAKVSGVEIVDLTDYLCPKKDCAPVIGGVLVYRQGAHITNTYAKTLAPVLAKELAEALEPAR